MARSAHTSSANAYKRKKNLDYLQAISPLKMLPSTSGGTISPPMLIAASVLIIARAIAPMTLCAGPASISRTSFSAISPGHDGQARHFNGNKRLVDIILRARLLPLG